MNQLQLPIRNAAVYTALRSFVIDSFALLRADRAAGADVAFSVHEHRRTRDAKPFYEYRPMTERFVTDRLQRILELATAREAMWVLASDPACNNFLRAGRADAVANLEDVARDELLVPLLTSMSELSPAFEVDEDALLNHYQRFERMLYADARRYVAVTPLWGVRLVYGDLEIADGVTLRKADPELFRLEWPEAAQWNWGEDAYDGLPQVLLEFERAVRADDDATALDPRPAIEQVVSVVRALAGGSVCAGPVVLERFDFQSLAPRPVPALAARRCGLLPSRIDGTVARALPDALRRLSGDPNGTLARALERYQYAATASGLAALRAVHDSLVEIYSAERDTVAAGLRMAAVVGASLPERRQFLDAMCNAACAIRDARTPDESTADMTRMLAAALRATIAAALVGELPIGKLRTYADSVLLGERERRRLGAAAMSADMHA